MSRARAFTIEGKIGHPTVPLYKVACRCGGRWVEPESRSTWRCPKCARSELSGPAIERFDRSAGA